MIQDEDKTFEWACPEPGCKFSIVTFSPTSRDVKKDIHLYSHKIKPVVKPIEWTESDKAWLKGACIKVD